MAQEPLLSMKGIGKAFSGNQVLQNVDFAVYPGKIMALLGENGAGKSTLMKILTGVYQRDAGEIFWNGQAVHFSSIRDSQAEGIAMIHQELNLAYELSVAENIFLAHEKLGRAGFIDFRTMEEEAKRQLNKLGLDVDVRRPVKSLSVGQQQLVEIAKALSLSAELIIMDEPTGALTGEECRHLFNVMKALRDKGKSFVYISHRLEEIFEICDDVTILRDGRLVKESSLEEQNIQSLIALMVGRDLTEQYPYVNNSCEEMVLEVRNLSNDLVRDCSFSLKKGEILGLAGLMGAGRTELGRTLFGVFPLRTGEILLHDKKVMISSTKDAQKAGIAYVSEDRKRNGLILPLSVRENTTIGNLTAFLNRFGMIERKKESAAAADYVRSMSIRCKSLDQEIRTLSGGNQQKVALAKALETRPEVLILDEPTRGVDVGAKREIYELINACTARGMAVLMISSEMEEILGMSDRIMVMHEGSIEGILERSEASQEKIMSLAVGKEG